ncbi:flavodoxin FldB, partial [Salmonella enterica subsp. enterica]|nr:flavodoxin FldB [Salmonella enterica subsp. enterica]
MQRFCYTTRNAIAESRCNVMNMG